MTTKVFLVVTLDHFARGPLLEVPTRERGSHSMPDRQKSGGVRHDGEFAKERLEQSFRIVGEDEADPSRGTISYGHLSLAP
jgi:hypothetical protein